MPIKAKYNGSYKDITDLMNVDESIDYVLAKTSSSYKRVYTATRSIEDAPPMTFKSIKSGANLSNYRIYGQTSRNLFDVTAQHTVAYETCYEYIISGLNPNLNYTCSTNYNQEDHTDAGVYFCSSVTPKNGVWQNEPKTYKPNDDGEIIILIRFSQYHESLPIYEAVVSGDIWIMVNEGDSPLPYEPYGESVGDRTGNLFDETIFDKNVANNTLIYVPIYVGDIDYVTCSTTCPKTITGDNDNFNSRYIFILSGNVNTGAANDANGVSNGAPRTIQPSNGYVTIAYRKIENHNMRPWEYQTMLNEGSTALPYEPYGYKVPVTVSDGTDTLTTNLYLPEQIRKVGDEAEYIDYGEQKQHRVRKNLFDIKTFAETCFKYSATVNYTNNTLTFTARGMDAYVNAALYTGVVVPLYYRSSCIDVLPSTTYTISMSSAPKCYISWVDSSFNVVSNYTEIPTNATSYTFTTPENCTKLLIRLGKEVTNIGDTFTISDIMLNSGSIPLPYEPYIENTEVDVTLPALPTLPGTNVLSVGTEVQPSKIDITGHIKTISGGS